MKRLVRRTSRSLAGGALGGTGLWRVLESLRRGRDRVEVLGYHRVVPEPEEEANRSLRTLITSSHNFRRHMEVLSSEARVVGMDEVVAMLSGRMPCEGINVAITFDDGYRDIYDYAYPILRELGLPAMVYVPTAHMGNSNPLPHDRLFVLLKRIAEGRSVGDPRSPQLQDALELLLEGLPMDTLAEVMDQIERGLADCPLAPPGEGPPPTMSWEQLQEMADNGIGIGVHTVNHAVLTRLDAERVTAEVGEAREEIEGRTGYPAPHFSYPNGRYRRAFGSLLSRAGFLSAVTTEDRENLVGANPYAIGRSCIWDGSTEGVWAPSPRSIIRCRLLGIFRSMGLSRPPVPGMEGTGDGDGHGDAAAGDQGQERGGPEECGKERIPVDGAGGRGAQPAEAVGGVLRDEGRDC